eukprot:CAMPEP_0113937194 /NCGR_PEP_ID=MMETSP1339-20121228/3867_1 /TAXON_ID=94617 /ORGANISM="Fibrocapsa japonica" /LENGTH=883 /DNA_ID=CAMNT_0000939869 /DNA_START=46 /DNA_END=2697 /DNA_ORIENTATION=- /assembly_acc=CAM_ASM_000762
MAAVDKTSGRVLLPADVTPIKYDIRLEPDLVKFTFDGEEKIDVQVVSATSKIVLHSNELYIKSASFFGSDEKKVSPTETVFNSKLQTLTFVFVDPIPVGEGVLSISFMGHLNNQMAGFYRSKYTDINGKSKYMASTQFEPLDARKCFPCWDEPALKASFELSIVVAQDLTAFSNMPEKEVNTLEDGRKEMMFMPTPKMSTYLVAICVGEFDFVQKYTKHNVLVRVYTPPGKSETGQFALDVGCRSLDLYNDFFQVPYPLPKLDMVAIPEFAMGAMENWGLVTYREVDLLIDQKKASSQQKQRVCTVVTHELAHQWFGNLVTMQWWDDLWLNEGFASWTQTYAADALFPEWKMWEQFVNDDLSAALRLDSLRTSHPIQVPIYHASEVEQVFDAISYCKGACVVRMLHAVLGAEDFRRGLQVYMDRHAYSNTETFHLWGAWEEVSGKPIQSMMRSWTEQMGYPVVKVVGEEWGATSVKLTLEQSWFLQEGSVSAEEDKLWTVPVIVASKSAPTPVQTLMDGKQTVVEVAVTSPQDWVKINFGQHIPCRVQYSNQLNQNLAAAVKSQELPAEDRAGLVGDSFALVKAGMMDVEELLVLIGAYQSEEDSTVWESLEMALVQLHKVLIMDEALGPLFESFAEKLVVPLLSKIGWQAQSTDGHLTKLLRATALRLNSRFASKTPTVIEEAQKRFNIWWEDHSNVEILPSEIKVSVFQIVLKNGGKAEYDKLKSYYDLADLTAEKKMVLNSIGAAPDLSLKQDVLDWCMSDSMKLQDFFYPMASVSGSGHEGVCLTWNFFQTRFEDLKAKLASASPSLMDAVIVYCVNGFCTEDKAAEIDAFFVKNPLPSNTRKISQTVEAIRINAEFLKKMQKSTQLVDSSFWQGLIDA